MVDIIIGILVLLAINKLYVYFTNLQKLNEKHKKTSKKTKNQKGNKKTFITNGRYNQAKEMADKVTTYKGIEALQSKIDKIYDKDTLTSADEEKISILEKAIAIASNKPFRYYIENYNVDMHTPLAILNYAGKTLTPKHFDELDKNIQKYFEIITIDDCEDASEAKEIALGELTDNLKEWKKFRKIVESNEDNIKKSKKLKNLINQSDFLKSELDFDEDEDYYEQYLLYKKAKELEDIPAAYLFVENGFDSREKILNLTDKEILSINGIGPKTLEYVKEALEKYR